MTPPLIVVVRMLVATTTTTISAELVELSYTLGVDAPTSPKLMSFTHKIIKKGLNKLNIWVELNDFCSSEHSGTHVDAPIHNNQHGWSIEEIPTSRLWRVPAVVVDVSGPISQSKIKNYEVKVDDLTRWEEIHGVIPDGALVLIRTGWSNKIKQNIREYAGLDQHNKINFPGVGKGAAEWLVKHGSRNGHTKGIVGVGIDTLSLDKGQSVRYPTHVALFKENIYGVENLANLDKLPATGFYVTVMPLRIGRGSGSPARIIAEVGELPPGTSTASSPVSSILILLLVATLTLDWLL
ncbi:isatin hydrolase-like [Homarus americanus]|uniref:Isatin hydrolase-like 1 n=1 Tax=Homarus americanus TaxID=6706 RepID=A0A8J5TUN8_HOMAM|nr:isatin hydrolase-like [Homarus americanus]KAG7177422.1 Isatin hydrolase-like 1 [Homarus americanus]